MTVTSPGTNNAAADRRGPGRALPTNGVIYVSTARAPGAASPTPRSPPTATTRATPTAATSTSAATTRSLTIASDNDIVIDGNITTTTMRPARDRDLLGLVANDFVRVYHPVTDRTGTTGHSDRPRATATGTAQSNPRSTRRSSPSTTRSSSTTTTAAPRSARSPSTARSHSCSAARSAPAAAAALHRLPQELQLRRHARERSSRRTSSTRSRPPGMSSARPSATPRAAEAAESRRLRRPRRGRRAPSRRSRASSRPDAANAGGELVARGGIAVVRRDLERAEQVRDHLAPSVAALERIRWAMRASVSCSPPRALASICSACGSSCSRNRRTIRASASGPPRSS